MDCINNHLKPATMTNNNNKNTPLTGLFTKHNDTTRFIFTNQTVNLNRYLEEDATQNEEAHSRENVTEDLLLSPAKGHIGDLTNEINTDGTLTGGSILGNNPQVFTKTAMNPHGTSLRMLQDNADPQVATGTETPTGNKAYGTFLTANGNIITPNTKKAPFEVPFINVTPASILQAPNPKNLDTAKQDNDAHYNEQHGHTNPDELTPPYQNQTSFQLYSSNLLDKRFKINSEDIKIPPELTPLKPLILSQHEVFSQPIQDLGVICLTLTKLIEKKKESLLNLKNHNKIPRSLRLKCELTTSPAYSEDPNFLELKEELQNEVTNFMEKGRKIMATWAEINVQHLIQDRCSNIFSKALLILDGLTSFHTDILGIPVWPSVPSTHTTLFLLKLYLSNMIFDISELVAFFELPSENILLIGTKTLLNMDSDNEATDTLDKLLLSDIDMNDELQNTLIREILINFDQILRFTTVYTWQFHLNKLKHSTAANNLKIKMKTLETTNASEATALAIAKATENIQSSNNLTLGANLRLSNLEKAIRRQEQRTNELNNNINKKSKYQKNPTGSHPQEPMASPIQKVPQQSQKRNNTQLIDLTSDMTGDNITNANPSRQSYSKQRTKNQKRQRKTHNPYHTPKKLIKWKEAEIKDFNPNSPANTLPTHSGTQLSQSMVIRGTGTSPFYPFSTIQPASFVPAPPNPFTNGFQNQGHIQSFLQQGHYRNPFQQQQQDRMQHLSHGTPQYQNFQPGPNPSGTNPFGTQYPR